MMNDDDFVIVLLVCLFFIKMAEVRILLSQTERNVKRYHSFLNPACSSSIKLAMLDSRQGYRRACVVLVAVLYLQLRRVLSSC
jgi:hypothetical protein